MTEQEIIEKLRHGERADLECKKAGGEIPRSVWETYSAFANTHGGFILLGVEENLKEADFSKRFMFAGVENPEKRVADFWSTINSDKVNVNILKDEDVGIAQVHGKNIIWIHVPQADYRLKPVYINENPLKGSFKRNNEGDFHCTENELKAMIRDSNENGNDGTILEGYTMEDIDAPSLKAYRIRFDHRNDGHILSSYSDIDFLKSLGGYAVDKKNGIEGVTTAGLLMFGKGLPIRDLFDNIRLDYLDMTNLVGDMRWSDRLTYDFTWENNLFNFFTRVLPKLVSDVKRPFKLVGMERMDDTPVHKAIREAFVNSIIHCDFLTSGVLRIEKHDDYFLFSNPGTLKIPVEEIYEGGHSATRNTRMQTMFRMIGMGDNIGSGFPAILKAWNDENWVMPELKEKDSINLVELKLTVLDKGIFEIPKNHRKSSVKEFGENEKTSVKIIAIMKDNPSITLDEIADKFGLSKRAIEKQVTKLRSENKIKRIGPDKGGHWDVLE